MDYRLVVGCNEELHLFTYNSVHTSIERSASQRQPTLTALICWNGLLLVSTRHGVSSYTDALKEVELPLSHGFAAAAAVEDILYMACDGAVVSCDPQFRELGRALLVGGHKDAHDLLVCGPRIFALDNIVYPVYAVLINVSDPRRLEVIAQNEIADVNPHLDAQFVDPEEHVWFVVQSSSHGGGSSQDLFCFSGSSGRAVEDPTRLYFGSAFAQDADQASFPQRLRFQDRLVVAPPGPMLGTVQVGIRLHATSSVTPCWTVISDPYAESHRTTRHHLCRARADGPSLVLDRFVELSFSGQTRRIRIACAGDMTFVVAEAVTVDDGRERSFLHLTVTHGQNGRLVYDGVILETSGEPVGLVDIAILEVIGANGSGA